MRTEDTVGENRTLDRLRTAFGENDDLNEVNGGVNKVVSFLLILYFDQPFKFRLKEREQRFWANYLRLFLGLYGLKLN